MKATGIVRRIDDLGRVVIPKEIRRTMRIRESDQPQITLTRYESFCIAMTALGERFGIHNKKS
jgi:AbrB family looped-hinge helix DNA binding protein